MPITYNDILYLFKQVNINSINDLHDDYTCAHEGDGHVYGANQPWILPFLEYLQQEFNNVSKQLSLADGKGLNFGGIYNKESIDNIQKYCCFFPRRIVISSKPLWVGEGIHNCRIPIGYFRNFFLYRKLLENELAYLSPDFIFRNTKINNVYGELMPSFNINEPDELSPELFIFPSLDYPFNTSNMSKNDKGIMHMLMGVAGIERGDNWVEESEKFMIAMPWLYNARINDYVELIEKYKLEFDNYINKLSKLTMSVIDERDLTNQIVNELKETMVDIGIALQKKQTELKVKGLITTFGICLTIVPFAIPQLSQIVDPKLLTSLLGAGSLKRVCSMLYYHF